MKVYILSLMILISPSFGFSEDCSEDLKASLLAEAQVLEEGYRIEGQLLQNYSGGVGRLRRLVLFPGTTAFADYFVREGNVRKIYFMENFDGSYRSVHANQAVDGVVFCSTDYQDVDVTWTNGFPTINEEIVCGIDEQIVSQGGIKFGNDEIDLFGGQWTKDGMPTACDGEATIGSALYTPVTI